MGYQKFNLSGNKNNIQQDAVSIQNSGHQQQFDNTSQQQVFSSHHQQSALNQENLVQSQMLNQERPSAV